MIIETLQFIFGFVMIFLLAFVLASVGYFAVCFIFWESVILSGMTLRVTLLAIFIISFIGSSMVVVFLE